VSVFIVKGSIVSLKVADIPRLVATPVVELIGIVELTKGAMVSKVGTEMILAIKVVAV
jgi:hypothetical protein